MKEEDRKKVSAIGGGLATFAAAGLYLTAEAVSSKKEKDTP